MNKYRVEIPEVHIVEVEVEAENEQQALEEAEKLLQSADLECYYSYTLEQDEWKVVKVEKCYYGHTLERDEWNVHKVSDKNN